MKGRDCLYQMLAIRRARIPDLARLVLLILGGRFIAASAQTLFAQSTKPPDAAHALSQNPKPDVGYLHGSEPNYLLLLPPYPALGSNQDNLDVATFRRMQVSGQAARWKLAEADDQMSYSRFSEALGIDLDPAKLPIVVHLLNRMERDVLDTAFAAKANFNRPRPFQRFAVTHVCGADKPPKPEAHPNGGFSASSYPSGHSAFGWGAALTLAEIAPSRAQPILARGHEFDESRVICAVHFPSDVAAGEIVATAVVERLHTVPEFIHDLACAQEEYRAAIRPSLKMSPECSALEKSLSEAQQQEE